MLDFGAARDGVPAADLGRRIMVDETGREVAAVAAAAIHNAIDPVPATLNNLEPEFEDDLVVLPT